MRRQLHRESILNINSITGKLNQIRDIDSLLDQVLLEARILTGADAGSIYLEKNGTLVFEHVQNDSLSAHAHPNSPYLYINQKIPVGKDSIAGHVAMTRIPLRIDDVYRIPASAPYSFNYKFDQLAHYRTRSMLTVPLVNSHNRIIGVMQIINSRNPASKNITFTEKDEQIVSYFSYHAATAIERALLTRETILRMIKMAELRDPRETKGHVNRVGAFSVEIYHSWAVKNGESKETIRHNRDLLRIAAMLHDVGKVGISDTILRKRSNLDQDEFHIIKQHTVLGARLFEDISTEWDAMAAEIALNHHERWDGCGYPGFIADISQDIGKPRPGKKGTEIPVFGRIVALADVYDALISDRVYKSSWSEQRVLDYIEQEKGRHFDPQMVDAFFSVYRTIQSIHQKYAE